MLNKNKNKKEIVYRYKTREKKAHDTLLKIKGVPCKLYQAVSECNEYHSLDPTLQPIIKLDNEYAVNINDKTKYINIKIFIIRREEKYHEIGMHTESDEVLRNNYIAYLSGDEVYKVGDMVEFMDTKLIIHKVFKHRSYSSIYRYLLSKGFNHE